MGRRSLISFDELRQKNIDRCPHYGYPVEGRTPMEWLDRLWDEVLELCDVVELHNTGFDTPKEDIGKEIADVVTFCDLLATRYGFNLGKLVLDKFNEISERVGSDVEMKRERR